MSKRVCFKTYIQGSYFGDIEIYKKCPRMFSVRAQVNSTLLLVNGEHFRNTMDGYPNYSFQLMGQSIRRYLSLLYSLKKIDHFDGITHKDPFWKEVKEEDNNIKLNKKVGKWLDRINEKNVMDSILEPIRE